MGDRLPARLRIEVTYAAGVHDGPLTGRLFLALSPSADPEPRIAAYNSARQRDGRVPFFATDVAGVGPGDVMVIETEADGYPYAHLGAVPPGDYWVQALVHVYTEFHRQDGHAIWTPGDQWEGQRWAFSPGNLVSAPRRASVDPASDRPIRLVLTDVIPPIDAPPDTERVKRVRLESRILSEWWGHPMYLMIGEPYARVLTGGSTGGWISLALQVHYPRLYGGTWTFYPDSVDFRRYQLIDIYEDASAFLVPNAVPGAPERMFQRTIEGQPVGSVRQLSQLEQAQGSRGRSGGQIDAWNAAYGPTGEDGYPRRVWDLETGVIDRDVAFYMRDNGYDLRHYLEENWRRIGPDLVGKIRIYNPEMDQFYLPYAVYLLEDFLEGTTDPHYGGEIVHGRPMKGHGWSPFTNAELVRRMADHIAGNAPAGASLAWYAGGR